MISLSYLKIKHLKSTRLPAAVGMGAPITLRNLDICVMSGMISGAGEPMDSFFPLFGNGVIYYLNHIPIVYILPCWINDSLVYLLEPDNY